MGDARRLLSQMQWDKVAPSIDIFNMLLKGYLRSGNVGAAQDVFRELEGSGTWDMDSLGIEPDVASYTCLMDHWANQGDVELAEKVLKKMEARGVAPDERAFGSLVKAYQRARDPEGAEAVLERVRSYDAPQVRDPAKYVGPKDERKKMKPNAVLFTTVISAYAAVGDMTNARRVLREMASKPRSWNAKPNERTFAHLSWGYAQLGDVAGITRVAQLMADAGVSLRRGTEGRSALARAFRECGLPTSHADALVDGLGLAPTPKNSAFSRRKYERKYSGEGERRRARAGGVKKNKPEVSSSSPRGESESESDDGGASRGDFFAETRKQNPAEVRTKRNSAKAKGNDAPPRPGPSRSGDAGWACAIEAPAGTRGGRRAAIGAGGRRSVGARRTGMFRGVAFLRGGGAFAFAPRAGMFA
jgi:pentatricopeptide repeat protein